MSLDKIVKEITTQYGGNEISIQITVKPGEWISVTQAANLYGRNEHTIRKLCDSGSVQYQDGGKKMIKRADLDRFFNTQSTKSNDQIKQIANSILMEAEA